MSARHGPPQSSRKLGTLEYNHRELRRSLMARGHRFRSECDAEVVVHLYEEYGADCVQHLRGMFAFAVEDGRRLLLARDRLGIKPLIYAICKDGRALIFASEIKAILRSGFVNPALDMDSMASFFVLGYPISSKTFFQSIVQLPPGHVMQIEVGSNTLAVWDPTSYFTAQTRAHDVDLNEAENTLWETLHDAVGRHLDADVDVSLTLSGGIDSTVLALVAAEQHKGPLTTYTVADGEDHPDLLQGRSVAQSLGATHVPVILNFEEYLAAIPGCIAAEEAYCSLMGLPYHMLSAVIARDFKVCIHGEGADELFGGYREYINRSGLLAGFAKRIETAQRRGIALPDDVAAAIGPLASAGDFPTYLERIFAFNLADALERYHLHPVDKCAMASSVEMRVPYMDDEVVRLLQVLPANLLVRADLGVHKYLLRRMCLRRFGVRYADIVLREKLGVPSSGIRLLDRFDQLCETTLPDQYLERHPMARYFGGKRELVLFDLFHEIFVVHGGDAAAVPDVRTFLHTRARDGISSRGARGA